MKFEEPKVLVMNFSSIEVIADGEDGGEGGGLPVS